MSEVDATSSADSIGHDPANPEDLVGPEAFKGLVQMYRDAFPDLRLTVDQQISDGDFVVTRWASAGTNTGSLAGMPPTGKSTSITGITIDKVVDGKIVESWTQWDNLGLMQQLGVGAPTAAAAN
jgi:steroid delta-isomerase-like uncharacterized protein